MIVQYLSDSGYSASAMLLQDEAGVRRAQEESRGKLLRSVKKLILGRRCAFLESFTKIYLHPSSGPKLTPQTATGMVLRRL